MKKFLRPSLALALLCVLLMAVQAAAELLPYRDMDKLRGNRISCTASGTYFAVAPDGRLVTWGSNHLTPHISCDSSFLPTPFFARRTMMKNVQEVRATGRGVLALDGEGTLWLWDDTHGNGGYPSVRFPFTDAPKRLMENVADFDKGNRSGSDIPIVTGDGKLWIMASNYVLQPGLGEANVGKTEAAPILEDVERVFQFYDVGFAVKRDGSLWAWTGDGRFRGVPYTPAYIAGNAAEVSGTGEISDSQNDFFLVLTRDGEVYTYDMNAADEDRAFAPEHLSQEPIADGVQRLYNGAWLKNDGTLERVTQKDGIFGARTAAENALYADMDREGGQISAKMTVTPDGRLNWDDGSVTLAGLSPKWRDAALWCLALALLLRWSERIQSRRWLYGY